MNMSELVNFSWMSQPSAWIGLVTLVALEIVLGIDNIVFLTILSGKLPKEDQPRGQKLGMTLAVIPRLVLLLAIPLILAMKDPLFTIPFVTDPGHGGHGKGLGLSLQDLVVLIGGVFLIYKATHEIHGKLEGEDEHAPGASTGKAGAKFSAVMVQIMVINLVFSLDSIVTAIGIIPPEQVMVMMIAVIISTIIMAATVRPVAGFVERHPTVKMLALSFLMLIGTTLVAEGFHFHIPKGYVYFAMAFSVFVEVLNLKASSGKKVTPVHLREQYPDVE